MIYCVEDDDSSRELILYAPRGADFTAEGFPDGKSLFKALQKELPDLILLDIMLPEEDGISILQKLRESHDTEDIPVIMETAKGTEYDKVRGLDLGADDYLVKPFGMMEMLSRVRAVLRRSGKTSQKNILRQDAIELQEGSHRVYSDGQEITLTLKEYELLHLFMKHPGRVYTREELLRQVWEEDFAGETRTVDVHIGTLRSKLGKAGQQIETVRGVGYRMGVPR
ncbi:MAG: response regulator transcription factor [Eubacterium sp.]|nr:response regulator transcription factor [Eubacterium sp.]MCH4047675.1 response regulator transcription factor [Eubacterium sp.]MCH4078447.1 response regulator transcription factor [Eubacterium sp.]MCH4109591.1 response regulator transcription factor [Eubacterium sp.]MCI1306687.1 response regulator transcription factor [Eubacterium sp.]